MVITYQNLITSPTEIIFCLFWRRRMVVYWTRFFMYKTNLVQQWQLHLFCHFSFVGWWLTNCSCLMNTQVCGLLFVYCLVRPNLQTQTGLPGFPALHGAQLFLAWVVLTWGKEIIDKNDAFLSLLGQYFLIIFWDDIFW